jgi:hypothetical protein
MDSPYLNLHYYLIASRSWIDKAILKALSEKRNFNEKEAEKAYTGIGGVGALPLKKAA